MISGNGDEGLTSLAPLFGHFVKVSRPAIALQGFILVIGSSEKKIALLKSRFSESGKCFFEKITHSLNIDFRGVKGNLYGDRG